MRHPQKLTRRQARGYNTVKRWVGPWLRKVDRRARTLVRNAVVRVVEGARADGTQLVQTAGGGGDFGAGEDYNEIDGGIPPLEQQGVASQVGAGARGVVLQPGGVPGTGVGVGLRNQGHRPTFLGEWEVCLYQLAGSRVYLDKNGGLRVETGLADYRKDGSDIDEGAKLRLHMAGQKGQAELYGEDWVRARAQASASATAHATAQLGQDGSVSITTTAASGKTTSITVDTDGNVTVIPSSTGQIRLGGTSNLERVVTEGKLLTELNKITTKLVTHTHDLLPPMGGKAGPSADAAVVISTGFGADNTFAKNT